MKGTKPLEGKEKLTDEEIKALDYCLEHRNQIITSDDLRAAGWGERAASRGLSQLAGLGLVRVLSPAETLVCAGAAHTKKLSYYRLDDLTIYSARAQNVKDSKYGLGCLTNDLSRELKLFPYAPVTEIQFDGTIEHIKTLGYVDHLEDFLNKRVHITLSTE